MGIALDYQIETPDGGEVNYGLDTNAVDIAVSWEQSGVATMTYWCEWGDLAQFTLALVGDVSVIDNAGTSEYSRFLPHRYPVTAYDNMWCTGITRIRGIPGNDPTTAVKYPTFSDLAKITYRYAEVTARYEPAPYPILSDAEVENEWERFTSITKTPRLEFLQVSAGKLFWITSEEASAPQKWVLPHNIPLREQSVDWIVTFHRVPDAFISPASYVGYINADDGFLAGHPQAPTSGFNKDTMLLLGINEIILPTPFRSEPYYTYQYLFQERSNTHNKARWHKTHDNVSGAELATPTYEYTQFSLDGRTPTGDGTSGNTAGNATRIFKRADMGALFLPSV